MRASSFHDLAAALIAILLVLPAVAAQRVHVVATGQTLGGLSHRYGIPVSDLRAMNQLAVGAPLRVGQKLLVPEPGEVARIRELKREAAKDSERISEANSEPKAASETAGTMEVSPPDAVSAVEAGPKPGASTSGSSDNGAVAAPSPDDNSSDNDTPAAERVVRPSVTKEQRSSPVTPVTPIRHRVSVPVKRRTHTVARGNTVGKLARRYHVSEEAIFRANGMRRTDKLKLGRKLTIPNGDDDPILDATPNGQGTSPENGASPTHGAHELDVPGVGPVYFYSPVGRGRLSMRPVLVYLHGRGGNAESACRQWSTVARQFGWLVCPSGPTEHNHGRTWNNGWIYGRQAVMGAIAALRKRFGRRVQLWGNTLIGFSEGAFVAMNVGVREPRTFNRWLILGADTDYWGGSGLEALRDARRRVRRVVLITGGRDQVVDETRQVAEWLRSAKVPLRVETPDNLAHELAVTRLPELYRNALRWLNRDGK